MTAKTNELWTGRVGFIDKPFDAGALLERMRELLAA